MNTATLLRFRYLILVLALTAVFSACSVSSPDVPTATVPNSGAAYTSVVSTLVAEITQTAEHPDHTPTPNNQTPTPSPPTNTATPDSNTATATLIPSPTFTQTIEPTPTREVIYQDDFQALRGWYTFEGERYRFEYKDGTYRITNNLIQASVNSVRLHNYFDVYMEVDANRISGPPNGYFGLVCRFQDDSNYYALVVGPNGFYGIALLRGGRLNFISTPPTPSRAVRLGDETNRIGASCIGDTFTLYANGEVLTEVKDQSFSSGYIGLMVGTTSVGGLQVAFDNFVVMNP
jgi:hypothetical protein